MIEELLGPLQRWLMQAGVLLVVGVAVWSRIVRPIAAAGLLAIRNNAAESSAAEKELLEASRKIAGVGRATTALLLPVWALGLVVQVIRFRDPFAPLVDDVSFLLDNTFWGAVWRVQGALLVVLTFSVGRLAGSRRGLGWIPGAIGVFALPVTLALSGHAMSLTGNHRIIAVSADALHTMAVGGWIGSLALILTTREPRDGGSVLAAQLRAFSLVALCAVPVLVAMGTTLSIYHLSAVRDLWSTLYGRVLLGKVLFAGLVLLLGFANWRRGLPTLDTHGGRQTVWRRAAWEVSVAGVVLAFTAVLTGLPSP